MPKLALADLERFLIKEDSSVYIKNAMTGERYGQMISWHWAEQLGNEVLFMEFLGFEDPPEKYEVAFDDAWDPETLNNCIECHNCMLFPKKVLLELYKEIPVCL